MNTKFQNKANLLEAVSSKLEAFPPNKPIYRVNPVNPVKKLILQNKAISTFLYPCILTPLYSCLLLNEPNFSVFGLKMRVFAENKPNLQPSIINHEFRNEANSISQFSIINSQFRSLRLRNEPIFTFFDCQTTGNLGKI